MSCLLKILRAQVKELGLLPEGDTNCGHVAMVQRQNQAAEVMEVLGVCGQEFFSIHLTSKLNKPEAGAADPLVASIMSNLCSV